MPVCNAKETEEEAKAREHLQSIYLIDIYLYSNASDKLNPGHDNRAFEVEASTWNPELRKEAEARFEYGMRGRDAGTKLQEAEERLTKETARADEAERKVKAMEARLAKVEKAAAAAAKTAKERLAKAEKAANEAQKAAEERLAAAETKHAALIAKVQALEALQPKGEVDPVQSGSNEKEREQEGNGSVPEHNKKRKHPSSCDSEGGVGLRTMIKRFVTDYMVVADVDEFIPTQKILSTYKELHTVGNEKIFEIELQKKLTEAFPSSRRERRGRVRGYNGVAFKNTL
jgi:hypothetical protein